MTARRAEPVSLRPHEVKAVFTAMSSQGPDATALSIARSTGLSTVVVVPALEHLCERGLVMRTARRKGAPGWMYQLTPAGLRTARASA